MTDLTNGDDIYTGDDNDDLVNGLSGNDIIKGRGGDDILNGGGDNDQLFGGANDDTLNGGSGDDVLDGGAGNDSFTGGSGDNDTVVIHLNAANGTGVQNGTELTLTTSEGIDTLVSGVERIQFDNMTIEVENGDALAFLQDDGINMGEDSSALGYNVLDNDVDLDDAMTVIGIRSDNTSTNGTIGAVLVGQYGTLTMNADGSYDYTADPSTNALAEGQTVTDIFSYRVSSGGETAKAQLFMNIFGINDGPSITSSVETPVYDDTANDDGFVNFTGTVTATDPDTIDVLTFGVAFGDTLGTADDTLPGYDTSVAGSYGTLYINSATGAYEYAIDDAAAEALKATAHDVFNFTVDDGHGGTDVQVLDVTVNGVNDRPDLALIPGLVFTDTAGDDTFTPQTGTLAGSDRDDDTLTYRAAGDAVDHSENGYNRSVAGTYGTLYLNNNTGEYKYVADDAAVEGLKVTQYDTFYLRATDGDLSSAFQPLAITLDGVNDTPDMSATDPTATLVEAGGVANGTPGTPSSSATVTMSDRDDGDTPSFDIAALLGDGWVSDIVRVAYGRGRDYVPATYSKVGTYGTATLNLGTGVVSYELDNDDSDTQALNAGDEVTDSFTVFGTDGTAGNSIVVTFTIDGTNDNAVIGGDLAGDADEAGGVANGTPGTVADGTATADDVDNPDDTFNAVTLGGTLNDYGTFTIDASGNWTYTIDEDNAAVQALNVGDTLSDSFTIFSADFTTETVDITIHGANDAAVVGGDTTGEVTESGGPLSMGDPDTGGTLTSDDVDNADNTFVAVAVATDADHNYGTYTIDASGNWTFDVRNGKAEVQSLNDGDTLEETFTVMTVDGTAQVITVTINGQNEVVEGGAGDDVLEGSKWGDTMSGLTGNDLYKVNNAADKIVEAFNEGQDLVRATVSYTLSDNVEDLTLTGSGALDGTGNGLDNVIVGNDGANILSGLAGDDTLRGNGGADTLIGGDNDDIMNGGDGNNDTASYATASAGVTVSLATTSFQNTVGAGFDKISNVENLTGSGFADTLTGDSGKNTITGGGDGDTLTGGDGVDTFVYENASDSTDAAADTILDLTNTDKIDLSAVDSLFHVVGSFTGAGHELVFSYNSVDDLTTLAGDIDGDTIADLTILMSGDHTDFDNFI